MMSEKIYNRQTIPKHVIAMKHMNNKIKKREFCRTELNEKFNEMKN